MYSHETNICTQVQRDLKTKKSEDTKATEQKTHLQSYLVYIRKSFIIIIIIINKKMFRQRVNISEAPEQCQSSTVLQLAGKSSAVVHAPITALVFTVHVSLIVGGDASPSQLSGFS